MKAVEAGAYEFQYRMWPKNHNWTSRAPATSVPTL